MVDAFPQATGIMVDAFPQATGIMVDAFPFEVSTTKLLGDLASNAAIFV